MTQLLHHNLWAALIHYPVIGKNGEIIASAVTNLDLHDIARAAETYGVRGYFVVTPLKDQKNLAETLVSYWTTGPGSRYNPIRRKAMELVRVVSALDETIELIHDSEKKVPKTIATCAKNQPESISYTKLRSEIADGEPHLLMFGTAWGLTPDIISNADYVLTPIRPHADYNHLSVRSAASIIFDRLIGDRDEHG